LEGAVPLRSNEPNEEGGVPVDIEHRGSVAVRGAGIAFLVAYLNTGCTLPQRDWPLYSYDYFNSNDNRNENKISRETAPYLQRAWETFNDSKWRPTPPPTGFVLEGALGLKFPSSVVGVISPPIVRDSTIYYIDELGTLFARDAKTGQITDPLHHWTTTLVDPDFTVSNPPTSPDLYYSAPVVDGSLIWIRSSFNGRLHAITREGGTEIDFDPTTPGVQPFAVLPDQPLASGLGESVIVRTHFDPLRSDDDIKEEKIEHQSKIRKLFISEVNVILNDALIQGQEGGYIVAIDITDQKKPFEAWRVPTIDINPATGKRFSAGVSSGSGLAVDHRRHLIFGGTGQNTIAPYPGYPDRNKAPAGYIDRSDSLYAIDYLTGKFAWVNQFHIGDVFNLNTPVSTGPNRSDGPRDDDVLSPPVLFTARTADGGTRDLVGGGSKGGLYRVVERTTGTTVWERQISKPTGIGGIQAGSAYADGKIYVAGFEGIDDGFSDANFNTPTSKYKNAFFATFSPSFWADVEDTRDDEQAITGMQIKVYSLDAGTGQSTWHFPNGSDYVLIKAGAVLRHVSVANHLLYVTTSSGQLEIFNTSDGEMLYQDQTADLNQLFNLGLNKPHHASMNGGSVISDGMVYVPYGAQNNPSGGMIAYRVRPGAR